MDSELFPEEEEELHEDPEAEDALLKEKLGRAEPKSLYSLLNVPQDATTEEIQRAFRSIAPGLHPDKHSHQSKEAASVRFQEIQRAAEVLGEARTRALYDAGGEELLASGLQVGKRAKKPQELREEYQQAKRQQKIDSINALVRAKGELTVSLNATQALEDAGHPIDIARRIGNIWITSQTLRSSFDVPLSSSTNLSLVHRMVLGQRRAGATYLATLRHQYSENLLLSLTPSLLSTSPVVISRAKYNLNQDSFAELSATTRSFVAPPTLNITGGTTVAQGWTSFVGFRSGQYSLGQWGAQSPASMATMPTFTISLNGGKGWVFTSETSLQQTTLSIQWAQRVFGSCRIRLATALSSLGGFSINCEGEALLPYDTISSANVALGTAGVSLKLKLSRLGQSIALPIQLSHETDTLLALSFVVIPTASFVTAQYLFFKPRKRRRIQARLAELRAEYSQDLIERQLEAKTAAALLRDQVLKRVETERRKSGLVILSASYGPEPSQETSDVNFVDVAVPLQALVTNSQLIIPGGRSKSGLLGFYDPCPGLVKRLWVDYEYQGRQHRTSCRDTLGLALPVQDHLVTG